MKTIGEKLTDNQLLLIKGGSVPCYDCECLSGPNTGTVWSENYADVFAIMDGIECNCGASSSGKCTPG